MNKRHWFKKTVAWLLIAAIANPAAIAPAFARDTDIFLKSSGLGNTGEPNILIVLDTSDSMNLPEPWREYPGAYDSHIEYLWNDINIISNTEQTTENASKISTAVQPVSPTSPYGFWAGNTLAERQALWTAAKNNANGTEPGDPGPRTTWRNYSEGSPSVPALSWYYWIPSSAATDTDSDPRLRSPMFNRFRAYQNVGPGTAGVAVARGGISFTSTTNYSASNACATAGTQINPSTVFNPSPTLRNSGKYVNDQWFRWENWINMDAVNVASYPGSQTVTSGFVQGYLDSSISPPASWSPIPASRPLRDNTGATNASSQGQPIRLQNTGTPSGAGWTDPKADLGGYEYQSYVNGLTGPVLQSIRGVYGYGLLSAVGAAGTVPAEKFSAWLGTRDNLPAAPDFGMMTGTPAYFDVTSNPLTACDPALGPASATCINMASGAVPNITLTKTRICNYVAGSTETDATGTVRTFGGSCAAAVTPVSNVCGVDITCSGDTNGVGVYPDYTDVPNPAACSAVTVKQNTFFNIDNGPTGNTPATTPAGPSPCAWAGRTSVAVAKCAWTGRSVVDIEGAGGGFFYYGGTCTENGSTASCSTSATTTKVLNGVSQNNVMGPYTTNTAANMAAGCSNSIANNTYWYGGTCQGGQRSVGTSLGTAATMSAASAANCTVSGVTNPLVIRGISYANVVAGSSTNGCNALADNNQTCSARGGYGGLQCDNTSSVAATNPSACPNVQTSVTGGGTAGVGNYYLVANRSSTVTNLVHECKADEPAANAGGGYMRAALRTWNTAYNAGAAASDASATAPYAASAGLAIAADTSKNIDVFSVNYLNWRFGPKGPNGYPIGRKTRLQIAKDALSDLVQNTDAVRFGLMVFNRTSTTLTSEGANVAKRILRMGNNPSDMPDYNNRPALINVINAVVATARTPLTEALYEAYLYYAGRAPLFGTLTTPAFGGGGSITQGADPAALCTTTNVAIGCPMPGATVAAPLYKSPMLLNPDPGPASTTLFGPSTCQRNFVILLTDGGPEDDWSANDQIKKLQWNAPTATDIVAADTRIDTFGTSTATGQFETGGAPLGPQDIAGTLYDNGYVWLDELAYFMGNADVSPGAPNTATEAGVLTDSILKERQSVVTYSVGFAGGNSPALSNAALKAGGSYYIAETSAELSKVLIDALISIREWNPTVAAPSVPISALNRAENARDVYLSFFKPDPTQTWDGTVKRFRLGTTEAECGTGITLCLTSRAVATSGFLNVELVETLPNGSTNIVVDDAAQSYWTPTADGGKPNEGGTGYQVIGNTPAATPDNRKVYTWLSGISTSANTTVASNQVTEANTYTSGNTGGLFTKAMLGLANTAITDNIALNAIRYIRGANLSDSQCTDGTPSPCSWRAWAHADVQHSRPAIVTYDPTPVADTQVPALQQPATRAKVEYIYYLSNDGLLHAVDTATGMEKWVFMVEEALPLLTKMQNDASGEQINIADGNPVVWIKDVNGNGAIDTATDKVYLYFGLRRGGRAYYALDITQRDTPTMLWKISNTTTCGPLGTSCAASAVYSELGQSWSTPVVGNIRALGVGVPALVFGGGYDTNQDKYKVVAADSMGRALFVVNGLDGTLVSSFGTGQAHALPMNYSVPSDPAAINSDLDAQGYLDRAYIGDTGGYLWRFDINNADASLWTGKLLANLSSDTAITTDRRKILFPPAVVKQNFGVAGRYDAVYVGTGDREHPTTSQSTSPAAPNDKIFMIKDPDWDVTQPVSSTTWTVADLIQLADNSSAGIDASQLLTKGGWYRDLDSDCTPSGSPPITSCGEKVTSAPTVFFNKLRFGTYTPTALAANSCSPAGEGRLNEIDALSGAFIQLNTTTTNTSKDRYYSTFLARGYVSTGQLIVVGKSIYHITVADARLQSILVGTIGAATKIYWYMEPEL